MFLTTTNVLWTYDTEKNHNRWRSPSLTFLELGISEHTNQVLFSYLYLGRLGLVTKNKCSKRLFLLNLRLLCESEMPNFHRRSSHYRNWNTTFSEPFCITYTLYSLDIMYSMQNPCDTKLRRNTVLSKFRLRLRLRLHAA